MAATRYGTIVHTIIHPHGNQSQHRINLRFKNAKARVTYEEHFDAYHASHDHEGPAPFFLETTATELGSNVALSSHPAELVTLDGYKAHEILEYHQAIEDRFQVVRYQPPTCCVPPLVALNNQFADLVRADTFERHELSTAFQDMPDDEFMSLIESITAKGIIDNIIKIHEGQILDGWHRYRACQELGILRKLRFQVWNTEKDGDPLDYVIAKNLDRRRHTASQVAQILLELTNRYGHGGDRSKVSKRDLETLETIAKRGNVSVSTMKRAAAVQKLDPETVESVKQGKVSATKALDAAKKDALIDQITANVSAFRNLYAEHYKKGITSLEEMFTAGITEFNLPKEGIAITLENPTGSYTDIKTLQRIQGVTDRFIKDWTAGQTKAGWIRKCLQTEDQKKAELWEKIDARLPKWKERLPGIHSKAIFENFTKALLIEKFREHAAEHGFIGISEIGTPGSPISLRELGELHGYIRNETFGLIYAVRLALLKRNPGMTYPDWQIEKSIAAEREMLSAFQKTGLQDYMDSDDLSEVVTKVYGFSDFVLSGEDGQDPLVWIQRFQIITNALKNNAGWVQDLSADMAEVTAEEAEVAAEEIADSLKIALQKWKEKRNYLPHLADATVTMVVDAAKRYDDIPAKGTIEAERVVTLLGSDVVIFQRYVEKLLEGVDIFKIPNNISLAGVEAFGSPSDAEELRQTQNAHVRAQTDVQEAFFTAIDMDEGEEDVKKFFAAVVEHCIPKLRLNIFSMNSFFYDTRTDIHTKFSEMYRGRDLTLKEIQEEIKVLEGIVREVEWWKADEGRVPRWMDDVVKAITPPTEAASEVASAKTYGEGTQGEFNTSDNARNPTESSEKAQIEEKVNVHGFPAAHTTPASSEVGEAVSELAALETEFGIKHLDMWIGWEQEGQEVSVVFDRFGGSESTPLRVTPDRIPTHLWRQLFEIANQIHTSAKESGETQGN